MRRILTVAAILAMLIFPIAQRAAADVQVGLSVGEDGIKGFYLAIGEHYQVPEKEIVVVRQKSIPDEELPVVFFLARQSSVSPETIIRLRLGGKSWMEITTHLGLTAEVFYVPVQGDPGPPYGKAYGHFKNRKKADWGAIRLTDTDIVNFVNLKFISSHYGYSPDEVIKMRQSGKDFVSINTEVKSKKGKAGKDGKPLASSDQSGSKGKDKGKGNGKKK